MKNMLDFEVIRKIGLDKIIIIAIAGFILIICSYIDITHNDVDEESITEEASEQPDVYGYTLTLEKRLANLINKIDGVDGSEVMITLSTSKEKILQTDSENKSKSEEGDLAKKELEKNIKTLVIKGENAEEPYVIKEIMPRIEGVVVVCKGAGDKIIENKIIEIIKALFDVEPHKISVIEMK